MDTLRAAASVLTWLLAIAPAGAVERNLFEWIAVAPIVTVGESLGRDGAYVEFRADRVMRGEVEPGSVVRVDVRYANRNRNRNVDPKGLDLDTDVRYVLLLEDKPVGKKAGRAAYRLVRGVRGARELPAEGMHAVVDALERFVEVQGMKSDPRTWSRLAEMLGEANPLLIGTALEQFAKFRRGRPDLLADLRPLLDHPRPDIREATTRVIGQIVGRYPSDEIAEEEGLRADLVSRARRDDDVAVRVAAAEALAGFEDDAVEGVLEEISESDPEQSVRYYAERILVERREGAGRRAGSAGRD